MKINIKSPNTMPEVTKTPAGPSGPVPIPYPNTSELPKLSPHADKQAKQMTQGHMAEQKISTQQMKSLLGQLADGKLPKGAEFLKSPAPKFVQELPGKIQKELSAMGKKLDPMNPQAIQDQFASTVGKAVANGRGTDVNALVQHVLRESYLETTKDLQFFKDKVQSFNKDKSALRDEIKSMREKTTPDAKIKKLEERLNQLGDDSQLANVDLQNILQKQQQTLQMMSNISKTLFDTAQSVIRKMGG
jgi:hypothetical protein